MKLHTNLYAICKLLNCTGASEMKAHTLLVGAQTLNGISQDEKIRTALEVFRIQTVRK